MKNLDVQKSIQTGRVQRKNKVAHILSEHSPSYFLVIMSLVIGFTPIWEHDRGTFSLLTEIISLSIGIIVANTILIRIWSFDKLKRVTGTGPVENREKVKKLYKELGWRVLNDNQKYALLQNHTNISKQEILIIYDQADVLINVNHITGSQHKSPFGYFSEKKSFNTIKEKFEQTTHS